jgi:hypothetical protein
MVDPGRFELPTFCVRSSCSPGSSCGPFLVAPRGVEPPLDRLSTCCLCLLGYDAIGAPGRIRTPISRFKRPDSRCLSYEGDERWSRRKESNPRPTGQKPDALSAELRRQLEEGLGFEPRRACSPGCFRDSCHQPDSANPPFEACAGVIGRNRTDIARTTTECCNR